MDPWPLFLVNHYSPFKNMRILCKEQYSLYNRYTAVMPWISVPGEDYYLAVAEEILYKVFREEGGEAQIFNSTNPASSKLRPGKN